VGAYLRLLRTPGAARLAASSLGVAVASTMIPVSFVLFARQATGSFATASLVLAAFTAGRLLVAPLRGRAVDRNGPAVVLRRVVFPAAVTDIVFILAGRADTAGVLLIALALLSGCFTAPAGTSVRSAWAHLLPDGPERRTGFALMSVLGEVSFFTGPLLAGALIAVGSPTLAVAAAAALGAIGSLALATAPAVRSVPAKESTNAGRLAALEGGAIRYVVGTGGLFGLTFGVLDVAWPAFAHSHGSAATAGIFLSLFAVGAGIGGLLYGTRHHNRPAISTYPALCLLAAAGLAPLIAAGSLAAMAALALLSGLCFAPITTAQVAAVDEVAVAAHRAEAYTWLGTIYAGGASIGAAAAGQLITASGEQAAFIAACAATVAAAILAALKRQALNDAHAAVTATEH
jgi:MFS family permease